MHSRFRHFFVYSGALIPFWLFFSVYYAGSFDPDFDHVHQLMSELGAKGSVVESYSPLINNYPLGMLFIIFGVGLYQCFEGAKGRLLISVCFVTHGLGSLGTGFFACDSGCPLVGGSFDQSMHTLFGLMMFFSLSVACFLMSLRSMGLIKSMLFQRFSFACFMIALVALMASFVAYWFGSFAGFFERIGYGVLCGWLLVLSCNVNVEPGSARKGKLEG